MFCLLQYAFTEERTVVGPDTKADDIRISDILTVVKENRAFVALCIHGVCICTMQYLAENVKYPASARQKKITGRVIIQFVVEKDGSITEAKVMKSVAPELDAEALRIVNSMPKWNPGIKDGKPVRVRFKLPISFKL